MQCEHFLHSIVILGLESKSESVSESETGDVIKPVADPGFPRRGGANSPAWGRGVPTYDFANFPKNCMKLKDFGPPGGVRVPRAPLDPPL